MTDPIPTEEVEEFVEVLAGYGGLFELGKKALAIARGLLAARQRIAELEAGPSFEKDRVNNLLIDQLRDQVLEVLAQAAEDRQERDAALVTVRELGWCGACEGSGNFWYLCPQCNDEHEHKCADCSGTGWHPAAQKVLHAR